MPEPLTDKEYVELGGSECPFCRSTYLDGHGSLEMDSNVAWQTIQCLSCGKSWTDEYVLTGYTVDFNDDLPLVNPDKGA